MKRKPTLRHILGTGGVALCLLWGAAARVFHSSPLADPPGTISGRVTRDGGQPAAGFTVSAYWAARPFLRYNKDNPNTTVTDAEGRYTLRLRPYTPMFLDGPVLTVKGYSVQVSNGGQPYVEPKPQIADPDARPDHTVSDVNFVLQLGPQITVRARDATTGTPDARLTISCEPQFGGSRTTATTGPNGVLRMRVPYTAFNLHTELPDTLEAAPGYGMGSQLYKQFTAAPGQEVVWNLKTYSVRTSTDANWHGVVLMPDGRPVAGISVSIMRQYGEGITLLTDAGGRFSTLLPRLAYGESAEWSDYTPPLVYARRGTLTITHAVTPDESWDGMTLRLAPGASLVGRLTDLHGRPAAGVGVSLSEAHLTRYQNTPALPQTSTDAQGHFTFSGLPPGEYHVLAGGSGFGSAVLPPSRHGVWDTLSAMPLAAGQHRNMGAWGIPRADQTLTGTVTDAQGRPYTPLNVSVTGAHTQQWGIVQKDGTFSIAGVVDEPLHVTLIGQGTLPVVEVAAGQKMAHLVVSPEAVAANVPTPKPTPAPDTHPRGPVEAYPQAATVSFNGLALTLNPAPGGAYRAAIVRPDGISQMPIFCMRTGGFSGTTLWQGTLDDVDGLRLTVLHNQGTLMGRTRRVLWTGQVQDAPDYVVTTDNRPDSSQTIVRDSQGKILWSGKTTPWANMQPVRQGVLRLYGDGQMVVWQKTVGNARVAVRDTSLYSFESYVPLDGLLTLHVLKATGTLRAPDGHVLWTGPAPLVTTSAVGSAAMGFWPRAYYLVDVQNAPPKSTMTFTDAAGVPVPGSGPLTFG